MSIEKVKQLMWPIVIGFFSLGFLIIAISISYYYLSILPRQQDEKISLERQKYEEEQALIKEEKEALSRAERDKGLQLDFCLEEAEQSYSFLWENQCDAWKVQVDTAWKNCRSTIYSWQTDAENKASCVSSTPDYNVDENGSCLLPTTRSSKVEDNVTEAKDECYQRYE